MCLFNFFENSFLHILSLKTKLSMCSQFLGRNWEQQHLHFNTGRSWFTDFCWPVPPPKLLLFACKCITLSFEILIHYVYFISRSHKRCFFLQSYYFYGMLEIFQYCSILCVLGNSFIHCAHVCLIACLNCYITLKKYIIFY